MAKTRQSTKKAPTKKVAQAIKVRYYLETDETSHAPSTVNSPMIRQKVDLDKMLKKLVKTGNALFGTNATKRGLKDGRVKKVVISYGVPTSLKTDLEQFKVRIYDYLGDSQRLGMACGKLFNCAAVGIIDPGISGL
jgi:large subunit ribosomal protein L30e